MVCDKCKSCKTFKTNDCSGLSHLNQDACTSKVNEDGHHVDVTGCC